MSSIAGSSLVKVSPAQWLDDIKYAIEDPKSLQYASGAVPSGSIIPLELTDAFNNFHVRAIAHAASRGEHEALMYLSFYVIHLKKLFTANPSTPTWEAYCDWIDAMPYGVSKSSIKARVRDIQDLLDKKMSVENIVRILAIAPMAARALPDVPEEKLPAGGINEAADMIVELGASGGTLYIADLEERTTVACIRHTYNPTKTRRFSFTLRTNDRANQKTYDTDYFISNMEPVHVKWILARFGRQRVN